MEPLPHLILSLFGKTLLLGASAAVIGCGGGVEEIRTNNPTASPEPEFEVEADPSAEHKSLMVATESPFTIHPKHTFPRQCLDVYDASQTAGTNVIQWPCHSAANQDFFLSRTSDGYTTIIAAHSGLCLQVSGASQTAGANVVQGPCTGGDNQKFTFLYTFDGDNYKIIAKHSGQCLDVAWASQDPGARLIQWTCHDKDNQSFTVY